MTGVRSVFSDEELEFMRESIGLELSDTKDYTLDELYDIHERILDELPCDFDADGSPLETGRRFESIVDKFYDHFDI